MFSRPLLALLATTLCGVTRVSLGQVVYRVTDLGSLGSTGGQGSEAWGLNDVGKVVGESTTNVFGASHAFLWSNGSAMQDLGTLGGTTSVARAVNDAGFVVGRSDVTSQITRAFLWQAGTGMADLGSLGGPDGDSEAWDISDASGSTPFQVVGWTLTGEICQFAGGQNDVKVGFIWNTVTLMRTLGTTGGFGGVPNVLSIAFALNEPSTAEVPAVTTVAGSGFPCDGSLAFCGLTSTIDSVAWEVQGLNVASFDLVEPSGFGDGLGEARDVNVADQLVGWGRDQSRDCKVSALLFESPEDTSPVDLHLSSLPPTHESRAEALTDPDESGNPVIVGANTTAQKALVWRKEGASWTVTVLNTQINAVTCDWDLRLARDINDDGWIAGLGIHNGVQRAFLLTPLGDCPADTDGNGAVDVTDLLAVLGHFGACPVGVVCVWDVNADCTVDNLDILALLGAYGPCPGSGGQGLLGGDSGSLIGLDAVVQLMGFADLPAYQAWLLEADEQEVIVSAASLAALLVTE